MKNQKIRNLFTMSCIIISCLELSCIENTPITPTATAFNFHLERNHNEAGVVDTTLIIDGDSVSFNITVMQIIFSYFASYSVTINADSCEKLESNKYWYNYSTNMIDSVNVTPKTYPVNTIGQNVLINSSYTAHPWKPFFISGTSYTSGGILFAQTDASPYIFNGIHHNTNEYFVFRKPKAGNYQYYYIKLNVVPYTLTPDIYRLSINGGKYKQASINTN